MDDLNFDNHAYIEDRSCLTAVLSLTEYLKKIREDGKTLKKDGYQLIPIIMAEDISSAFESIDHDFISAMIDEFMTTTM